MNPPHETARVEPFWQVQSVFDPDCTGKDFAYTIGLHERGLPELHIWARPSLGEDPGHDWMFSNRDRCEVLNELAAMAVEGRLPVGSEVTREYDSGLAQVTFRVEPPGDKEALEAYGVPPGVDVLPVLWSLHRAPEGPPTPLTEEAEEQARALFREITRGLDLTRKAPRGWQLPAAPSFDVDQRYGPLTPVVLARAAQLWQADDDTLADFLHAGAVVECGGSLSWSTSMAIAVARPVGRRRYVEMLHDEVHELTEFVTSRPAAQRRWTSALRGFDPGLWDSLDRRGRDNMQHNLSHELYDLTRGCLMTEAVADQASHSLLLQARGPWVSATRHEPVLTDPAWRAAPEVLDVVHALLDPLDYHILTLITRIHRVAHERMVIGAEGYGDLCARLESWALTSAASCPWHDVLCGLPGWQPLLRALPGAVIAPMWDLGHWATCVASALTHRARLSAEDVHTFAVPFATDLPQLEAVLNTPV